MTKDNSIIGIAAIVCLVSSFIDGSGVGNMIVLLAILFIGVPMAISAMSSSTNLSDAGHWLITIGAIFAGLILFLVF